MITDPYFKKVAQFQYSAEAFIYKAQLESHDIEVFVRDNNTVDSDPLLSHAIGGVKLFVRAEDHDEAVRILSEISGYSLDDDGAALHCPDCSSTKIDFFTTIRDSKSLAAFALSLLVYAGLPIYTKYKYRCEDCGAEFNTK